MEFPLCCNFFNDGGEGKGEKGRGEAKKCKLVRFFISPEKFSHTEANFFLILWATEAAVHNSFHSEKFLKGFFLFWNKKGKGEYVKALFSFSSGEPFTFFFAIGCDSVNCRHLPCFPIKPRARLSFSRQ